MLWMPHFPRDESCSKSGDCLLLSLNPAKLCPAVEKGPSRGAAPSTMPVHQTASRRTRTSLVRVCPKTTQISVPHCLSLAHESENATTGPAQLARCPSRVRCGSARRLSPASITHSQACRHVACVDRSRSVEPRCAQQGRRILSSRSDTTRSVPRGAGRGLSARRLRRGVAQARGIELV